MALDEDPRFYKSLQTPDDILPVFRGLAFLDDRPKCMESVRQDIAVEVFKRESDISEGDFYGFGLKLGAGFLRIDKLLLLFC